MKKIHILESTLRYLLDEGRNAEKAKQKTIAVMKNYLSQNGAQGEQLESMAMEYEHSLKEWLFHANMPDSIIRLEPIMANVAMQLGFAPKDRDTRELYRLKDIMNYIIANYKKDDFPIALNKLTLDNTSFDSLNELFGSAMDTSKSPWKPSNDDKPKPHYTVKRLDTFGEAHKYHPYTQDICYLKDESTWNQFTKDGKNAVYVLLRDGWEDIPAEHGKNTPYDDYGESMVFIIIRSDGGVAYSNTRWNHETEGKGPIDVDQSFTENMKKVSDMLQTDYRNVLKPYTEEELLQKGIMPLPILRKRLSDGEDIFDICELSIKITNKLYKCYVAPNRFVIFNIDTKTLIPDGNEPLFSVSKFIGGNAFIYRVDHKTTIINQDGEQICDWYRQISGFDNGLAEVWRDDGKQTYINMKGQQICGWYVYADEFVNGLAMVERDDCKWSVINTDGKHICGWYDVIYEYVDGMTVVGNEDGTWYHMDMKGNLYNDEMKLVLPSANEEYEYNSSIISEALHKVLRNYLLNNYI